MLRTITKVTPRETPRESGKREGKGSESYIPEQEWLKAQRPGQYLAGVAVNMEGQGSGSYIPDQEWLKAQRPGRYIAGVAVNTDRCKTQSTKQSEELPRPRG